MKNFIPFYLIITQIFISSNLFCNNLCFNDLSLKETQMHNNPPKNDVNKDTCQYYQTYMQVIDSCYKYIWSDSENDWEILSKYIYSYDTLGTITEYLRHEYDEESILWNETDKCYSLYTDSGEIAMLTYLIDNEGDLINDYRDSLLYDADNKLTEEYNLIWDNNLSDWLFQTKLTYDYYEKDSISEKFEYSWDTSTNTWINNIKHQFLYDNNITEQIAIWDTSSISWLDYQKIITNYNDFGLDSEIVAEYWDTTILEWINDYKSTTLYNINNNKIAHYFHVWDTSINSWINFSNDTIIYNDGELETEFISQYWNSQVSSCVNNTKSLYTYNYLGKKHETIYQEWSQESSSWVDYSKNINYLSEIVCNLSGDFTEISDVTCYGYSDGNATISISGGLPPYIYQWDDAQSTTEATVSGLSASNYYHVTVSDSNYCTYIDSIKVSGPLELSSNISKVKNISCYGYNDGIIAVSISGGTEPYNYLWDDTGSSTGDTVSGLAKGIYHVTITDFNSCMITDSVLLTEPSVLISEISDSTNISCYGYNDGSATVSVLGGTFPYSYIWDDIASTDEANVEGLSANIYYYVTITDSNNCEIIDSIILSEPYEIITGNISGPVNAIQGETSDYNVPQTEYSFYYWTIDGGEVLYGQNTYLVNVLWNIFGTGIVSVVKVDINNCQGETSKLTVDVVAVGISENISNGMIYIYPNPFDDYTNIYLPENLRYDKLEIFDITGNMIKKVEDINNKKIRINKDNLSPGIYFIKIYGEKNVTKKLIIE
ncbi:MAG: T9SS type A sorting domain-containing protein [Bacteroidales bacterium]|nr:T9SS type A sorting domain-containing protein [Bacteroidales bacterium]